VTERATPADEPRVRADGLVEDVTPEPLVVRRRGRRVSTGPVDGVSREPAPERQQSTENDDRLRGDRPPHWG
jgi:hypothetical protein